MSNVLEADSTMTSGSRENQKRFQENPAKRKAEEQDGGQSKQRKEERE